MNTEGTTQAGQPQTVVVVQTQVNGTGADTGMDAYLAASAKQCPMNGSCSCCTCRCCGFCILICWMIFGAITAATSFSTDLNDDNSYTYAECPSNTGDVTGECCGILSDDSTQITVYAGTCDNLSTAITLTGVNSMLGSIAGLVGVIGLAQLTALLILAPMGYALLALVLDIVVMALIWGGWLYLISPFFSVGFSLLIFFLFYKNYRLIKTMNPKNI